MNLLDFKRTVPYKKRTGILGYFQLIYHNFFDLVLLNIMFVVTSLPIVTIGASYTAFISVCNKYAKDEVVYPLKEYFINFKNNFLKSALYGIIFTITIFIISFSCFFYFNLAKEIFVFYLLASISLLCLFLVIMTACWFFPLYCEKKYDFKRLIIDSFFKIFINFARSIVFLLTVILVSFAIFAFFPYSLPFIVFFPVMIIALCSSYLSFEPKKEKRDWLKNQSLF